MSPPPVSLRARALRYLARREHSRAELERKLARHAGDLPATDAAVQIRRVLDDLAERGLLSEQRAAESLLAALAGRFGKAKLRHKLRERGIDSEVGTAALDALADDELARARAVWQRKFGAPASDAAGRARQARFLAGRGFAADIVRRVVRGLDDVD